MDVKIWKSVLYRVIYTGENKSEEREYININNNIYGLRFINIFNKNRHKNSPFTGKIIKTLNNKSERIY